MKTSHRIKDEAISLPLLSFPEVQISSDLQSNSTQSNEQNQKISKLLWMELSESLRQNQNLRSFIKMNIDLLNVSKETLCKFRHTPPLIKQIIDKFGNQNCIRAISVLEDFTSMKKNQYKFMYERLTLAKAIELLVKESGYLYKSLSKQRTAGKHFLRITRSWIDYIFLIHEVPEDAQEELKTQIVIHVGLMNKIPID